MGLDKTFDAAIFAAICLRLPAKAQDWQQFRGPKGDGKSLLVAPQSWSDRSNLKWVVELPGRGVSSPIVVGDDVFVTAFSGEVENAQPSGEASPLVRSLVCVDRQSGDVQWQRLLKSSVRKISTKAS